MLRVGAHIPPVLLTATLLASVLPAAAEPYLAGFVGAVVTENKDLNIDLGLDVVGPVADGKIKDVAFDDAVVFGGKVGYFLEGFLGGGFGIEAEGYHFSPSLRDQRVTFVGTVFGVPTTAQADLRGDLEVTAVGLNLLYRFQLAKDEIFRRGRVQPYVGLGIAAAMARLELQTFVLDSRPAAQDTAIQPAAHALGGIKIFLTEHLALFTEYKFMHTGEFTFHLSKSSTLGGSPATESSTIRTRLTSQQFYAGVSFHW